MTFPKYARPFWVLASAMAFLSGPMVFLSHLVWGAHWVSLATAGVEIFVLLVISAVIVRPFKWVVMLLRAIAILIAFEALVPILLPIPRNDATMLSPTMLLLAASGLTLAGIYIALVAYLPRLEAPSLNLLRLHSILRLCGFALFLLGNVAVLPNVAAQIVLGVMVLRHATEHNDPR